MMDSNVNPAPDPFAVARAAAQARHIKRSRRTAKANYMGYHEYRNAHTAIIWAAFLTFILAALSAVVVLIFITTIADLSSLSGPDTSNNNLLSFVSTIIGIQLLFWVANVIIYFLLGIFVVRHSRVALICCIVFSAIGLFEALLNTLTGGLLITLILRALFLGIYIFALRAAIIMRRYETGVYPSDAHPKTQLP